MRVGSIRSERSGGGWGWAVLFEAGAAAAHPSAAVMDVASGVDGLSANAARKTAASQRSGAPEWSNAAKS